MTDEFEEVVDRMHIVWESLNEGLIEADEAHQIADGVLVDAVLTLTRGTDDEADSGRLIGYYDSIDKEYQ